MLFVSAVSEYVYGRAVWVSKVLKLDGFFNALYTYTVWLRTLDQLESFDLNVSDCS